MVRRSPGTTFAAASGILAAACAAPVILTTEWHVYWAWLAGINVTTAFFFGFDKLQAAGKRLRVPEAVLKGQILLGGVVGGWIGRTLFRHKTRKTGFTRALLLGTAIHAAVIYRLCRM